MSLGFITVKRASESLGFTPHYIRKLIRENKIIGQQIKNSNRWQVDRASIEQYRKTDIFKEDLSAQRLPQQMTLKEVVENVEEVFEGDVITYIMNPGQSMIDPSDSLNLDNLLTLLEPRQRGKGDKKFKRIIFVLHSGGGILEAAIKLVGIAKAYAEEFHVIVPLMAKSAATIIALKADKLFLTPVSELGPVDPIVQSPTNPSVKVPAQSIEKFIQYYGKHLSDTSKTPLDEMIISKLGITLDAYLLGAYKAAQEFSESELKECLKKYNLNTEQSARADELFLNKKSHSYPILLNDLQKLGIGEQVTDALKLKSIKMLMGSYQYFMSSHNIVKLIGNREINNNTVLPQTQIKQRAVQTGN